MKLNIVSLVKINDQWVRQEKVPPKQFQEIVANTIIRAGNAIGAKVQKSA